MIALIVLLVLILAVLAWAVAIYNRLVRLRNLVKEGWSGIEVQLKRRSNLIPNLIESVKGYMGHEKGVLEKVTALRSQTLGAATPEQRARLEGDLTQALGRLFAVAEAYPDLKANQSFLDLQDELSQIEEQIQLARRYYNGTVRDLNIAVESFPSNIIAGMFQFRQAEFFEIEDAAERAVPKVQF